MSNATLELFNNGRFFIKLIYFVDENKKGFVILLNFCFCLLNDL